MIEASVNVSSVLAAFQRIQRRDGRKVFREARQPMRKDIRDHAARAMGPTGKWPSRSQATRERRGNRRKLLGRVPAAYAITIGADFIRATWRQVWMKVHATGGTVGHGARVPSRRFDWASKALRRTVRDLYMNALSRAWAGR